MNLTEEQIVKLVTEATTESAQVASQLASVQTLRAAAVICRQCGSIGEAAATIEGIADEMHDDLSKSSAYLTAYNNVNQDLENELKTL